MAEEAQSAKDFIVSLKSGTAKPPVVLVGMAKLSDTSENALMFSTIGCENWIELPIEVIANIQTLGIVPCKDHNHPRVRIELTKSDDPTAQALASLLAQRPAHPQRSHSHPAGIPRQLQRFRINRSPDIGARRYFRLTMGECDADHPICYGDMSNCPPNGCACCDESGECYCSTSCCVA